MTTTARSLIIRVDGAPAPQGSKRLLRTSTGKAVAVEASKKVAPWRDDVRSAAIKATEGEPWDDLWDSPLEVVLTFRLGRPKSHYRTGKYAHLLKDAAPSHPSGPPDVDKLARAVLDAITGVVFADDKTVVVVCASKVYAARPGCDMRITRLA